MIRGTRVILRSGFLFLWTALAVLLALPSFLRRWVPQMQGQVIMMWAKGVARILSMRIRVAGTPPKGVFFLVCNHLSYIDIIPLLAHVRGFFVARSDANSWPLIKWMIRASGSLLIDRSMRSDVHKVNERIKGVLKKGNSILLFLESTTSKGDQVYPFKSPLLALAAEQQIPVIAAALSYRTPPGEAPAYEAVCWWDGSKSLAAHLLSMTALPHFEATLSFSSTPMTHTDRKVLAHALEREVGALFIPTFVAKHEPAQPPLEQV